MEILQTIMTALTTPNEELFKIIAMPLHFLETYVCMHFFLTILNIPCTKKQKLIYTLTYGILGNIITFIVPVSYTIFVNIILAPLTIFFIFKTTILKSILAEIITTITTTILEFIIANVFINILHLDYSMLMTIPIYRILAILGIYFSIFIITKTIKYLKLNIKVIDSMNIKTKTLLISNLLLLILFIALQFYLVRFYSDTMPFLITLAGILVLISYFAISVYNVINISKLETTERDLEGAHLTIQSLRALHDTVRTFKHDFDNMVNSIGGYVRTEDISGLTKYYEQLLLECHKTNNLYSLSPDVINHPAIYNILAAKYYDADALNILIHLDIFLDLNEIENHMKIYEFTRILGILLDNSIEAAKQCEDKKINVTFRKEETKHRLVIIIENTYTNKDVDTDKIFEKGISSKENKENCGLGLWKVREILKRNNNLNLFTSKNTEYFKQQFEIYY